MNRTPTPTTTVATPTPYAAGLAAYTRGVPLEDNPYPGAVASTDALLHACEWADGWKDAARARHPDPV